MNHYIHILYTELIICPFAFMKKYILIKLYFTSNGFSKYMGLQNLHKFGIMD